MMLVKPSRVIRNCTGTIVYVVALFCIIVCLTAGTAKQLTHGLEVIQSGQAAEFGGERLALLAPYSLQHIYLSPSRTNLF